MDNYQILGVPYNADQRTVKRAYAALIKQYRPDSHPLEFARIRSAYEKMMEQCRYRQQYEENEDTASSSPEIESSPSIISEDSELIDKPVIQPISEDWQTENSSDSFEQLIEKPFINLPEIAASIDVSKSEDTSDPFSRLVNKPIIQPLVKPIAEIKLTDDLESKNKEPLNPVIDDKPILNPIAEFNLIDYLEPEYNEHLDQSIHKPVIEQTQTAEADFAADVDDLAWAEKPAINISALIATLNAYQQPANEQVALACFQAQLVNFSAMNLDQRMDYEEKLYFSLLFNDRPSLLVLDAASEYFDWKNNLSWIKAAQSKWNKQRFEALSQLAVLYRRVCQHYNPFFIHHSKSGSYWLTTHYHHLHAQNERDEWIQLATTGGLSALLAYVTEKPKHRTLYIVDVLLGGSLSYLVLTGILSDQILNYPALEEYYWAFILPIVVVAIMGGFLSALLFTACRAAWQYWQGLEQKIHNRIKWAAFFVAIVLTISLAQQDRDGFLVFMVSSGFLLFIVLRFIPIQLYQGFIQLENVLARIMNRIAQNPLVQKKFTRQQTGIKLHRITNINLLFREKKITPQQSFNFKRVNITMNKQIYPLLIAQFLSAFGDNAILFTVLAIVIQAGTEASWYIPALQAVFLVAYVILGPWVGGIADRHAKARILLIANLIKASGTLLLLIGVEPLLAYGIVGMGAAIYSPAKYGILPELVGHDLLVKANSWIEGSTILAILLGMKVGAMVADHSTSMALLGIVVLYIISAFATLALPTNISKKEGDELALVEFGKQMALFFTTPRSRFGVLGASIFWAAAASLRVILIAWAPLVLLSKNASQIADLTLYLTVGIIVGAIAVPKLIPLEHLRRARIPAYIMGVLITCLSMTTDVLSAQIVLFGIGIVGGMFIVPVNACLQEQGKLTIGSGSAVALQNFFQNLAMLLAVGAYTLAASQHVDPVIAMFVLGILVFLTVFAVSLRLPERQTEKYKQI